MKRTLFALAATAIAAAAFFVVFTPFAGAKTSRTTLATVHVQARDTLRFALDKKKARHGITIFKVKNVGALKHDFWIAGKKTKMLSHNQTATLRVRLTKGKHPYKCTVPGHAAAGMKGVFTST